MFRHVPPRARHAGPGRIQPRRTYHKMKVITAYATLLALGTVERNDELKKLSKLGDNLANQKTEAQKLTAKILVAMEEKGECKKGEFKAHAKSILGRDIREVYQDVYGLINVFRAILHGMNPERILIAAEGIGLGRATLASVAANAASWLGGRVVGADLGLLVG